MTANVKHDMKSRTVLLQTPYLCEHLMHILFKKKVTLKIQLWLLQSTYHSQTTENDIYNDQTFLQYCQSYLHMK
jgi:hypothetical protein